MTTWSMVRQYETPPHPHTFHRLFPATHMGVGSATCTDKAAGDESRGGTGYDTAGAEAQRDDAEALRADEQFHKGL